MRQPPPNNQSYTIAARHHRSGNYQLAEAMYRQILAGQPNHSEALHMLGILGLQTNRFEMAADYIGRAMTLAPNSSEVHGNLGMAMERLGRYEEAADCYRKALSIKPNFAVGHMKLADVLRETGQTDQAIAGYRRALSMDPSLLYAWINLGNVLQTSGQLEESAEAYQKAMRLSPSVPELHNNLGNLYQSQKKMGDALACYRRAIELKPDYADAYGNLGVVLSAGKQTEEAIKVLTHAIELNPEFAVAHNNLGNIYKDQGRFEEAMKCYNRALEIRPDYEEAHNNLGNAYQDQGELDLAVECYQRALALNPNLVGAHNNLGNTLAALGRLEEAIENFERVIAVAPDRIDAHFHLANALQSVGRAEDARHTSENAIKLEPSCTDAYNSLGNACKDMGLLDECLAAYRKALELKPEYIEVHSNLVYTMHFHPGYDSQAILREHLEWRRIHSAKLKDTHLPHDNDPTPNRKLKIGYLSPDFRDHCQIFFTFPLLSNHDHERFEIHLFSLVRRPDDITEKMKGFADHWHHVYGEPLVDIAKLIREYGIDILVDLTMHMGDNKMLILAQKPAPVQVSWLAYPSTTGVEEIDYRFTDPYLDPPGKYDEDYSEVSLRLPDSFWCYDATVVGMEEGRKPEISPLPALKNGYVTFGCLNNFCKINAGVVDLWSRAMTAVPNSRLRILAPEGTARDRLIERFKQRGIERERVEFFRHAPRVSYLHEYDHIDLGLDTQPYNGHTTSLDSFWMGVPVVTLVGKTIVGRAGWSLLSNMNLRELAAQTPDEFVEIARNLANDLPRLADLRANLRQRMEASPLMDGKKFARGVEDHFTRMWKTWCDSKKQ